MEPFIRDKKMPPYISLPRRREKMYIFWIRNFLFFYLTLFGLTSCSSSSTFLPSSGPSSMDIAIGKQLKPEIAIIDVNQSVAHRISSLQKQDSFADNFPEKNIPEYVVGPGDTLQVIIWEASPATLFGLRNYQSNDGASTTPMTALPEQMVASNGMINIPFISEVSVSGLTPQKIEKIIAQKLKGKANQPQVMVRVTHNATSNVTVVGEVGQSLRLPLTPKGERLLDGLAAAGGVRQPVDKMTIQLSRDGQVQSMSLDSVIQDPTQNILLHANDVLTAIHAPLSFTALGATGNNSEVDFEAKGITLAQALGRVGGLNDTRANPKGVFIFRFEIPEESGVDSKQKPVMYEGKIPVIYRVDLTDPSSFLVAQNFPIRDKDVIYIANAPAQELQKFVNILFTSVFSIINIRAL